MSIVFVFEWRLYTSNVQLLSFAWFYLHYFTITRTLTSAQRNKTTAISVVWIHPEALTARAISVMSSRLVSVWISMNVFNQTRAKPKQTAPTETEAMTASVKLDTSEWRVSTVKVWIREHFMNLVFLFYDGWNSSTSFFHVVMVSLPEKIITSWFTCLDLIY